MYTYTKSRESLMDRESCFYCQSIMFSVFLQSIMYTYNIPRGTKCQKLWESSKLTRIMNLLITLLKVCVVVSRSGVPWTVFYCRGLHFWWQCVPACCSSSLLSSSSGVFGLEVPFCLFNDHASSIVCCPHFISFPNPCACTESHPCTKRANIGGGGSALPV